MNPELYRTKSVRFGFPGILYFLFGPLCWWHGRWSERSEPARQSGAGQGVRSTG